jgi:succinyl-CoA synthetase beta subunit
LSRFAARHSEDVAEIDINPLLVREKGEGVVALDALIIPKTAAKPEAAA